MPYVEILANFRGKVRSCARILKANDILRECDRLRDDVLPNIGIQLEDSNEEVCKVKMVNREELLKEKEAKKKLELEKVMEKEKRKAEAAAAAAAKEAQRKIRPYDMFKLEKDKYSQFDETVSSLNRDCAIKIKRDYLYFLIYYLYAHSPLLCTLYVFYVFA
jgi:cysteinyl-tRNA synthetase